MRATKTKCTWRPVVGAAVIGMFAFSVMAYGGPRSDKTTKSNQVNNLKVIKISPPTNKPFILPEQFKHLADKLEILPQDATVVTFEMRVDNTTGGIASGGDASAFVFLDTGEHGAFLPIKSSDAGSFVATQRQFSGLPQAFVTDTPTPFPQNGWVPGGFINGISLLVFNSSANSGTATLVSTLWDGDPFAIWFTACSFLGVPAPILGTTVVFPNLAMGDQATADAGLCKPLDDPSRLDPRPCPGLHNLVGTFDKVQVNCNQVYHVYTLDEGCRLGWRLSGVAGSILYAGPEIGYSDLFEMFYECGQFAGAPCPNSPTGRSVGFCCDNPAQACDDRVVVSGVCAHTSGAFCTSGTADTTSATAFGGVNNTQTGLGYFASLTGTITAATSNGPTQNTHSGAGPKSGEQVAGYATIQTTHAEILHTGL